MSLYIPILWNPTYTPLEEGSEFPSLLALATYCTIIFLLLFWRKIYSHIITLKLYRWRKSLNFSFFLSVWGLNWGNKVGLQWAPSGSVLSSRLCFLLCFTSPSCELSLWLEELALEETPNCSGRGPLYTLGWGCWGLIPLKQVLKILKC